MGRYLVESVIGTGGFATVYRATDTALQRAVALKVVDPAAHRSPTIGRRFLLEGRAVASLSHPAVVPVFDAGEDDGVLWLAMRLIDGCSLDHAFQAGRRFRPEDVIAVVERIGAALDHAHGHGIVHRDVKPSNILLEGNDPARAWLTDFGIAATARTAGLYTTGALGTAAYMAPEQSRPSEVGPPADLYSLACVAYEMLADRRPFPGDDYVALLFAHATAAVPPTGHLEVDALMARALAKQPDARPVSGAALTEELRAALALGPSGDGRATGASRDGHEAVGEAGADVDEPASTKPVPSRLLAAGVVPTVVDHEPDVTVIDHRDDTLVYPKPPPPAAPPRQHRPPQQHRPAPPARRPLPPVRGSTPRAAAPPQWPPPPRDPTVARRSRRLGRRRLLIGIVVLLVAASAAAGAYVQLEVDASTQRIVDDAGVSYEVPDSWGREVAPGIVTWTVDDQVVATVSHEEVDANDGDATSFLAGRATCLVDPVGAEVDGADSVALCDNPDDGGESAPAVTLGALTGDRFWEIAVQPGVPEDERADFLASLTFT